MSEIIVGYDGSDSSKAALSHALEFAKALGDSVVIVFGDAPGGYGGGEVPEQRKAVEEFARKVTQEALETAEVGEGRELQGRACQRARSRGADHRREAPRCPDDRRRVATGSPRSRAQSSAPTRTSWFISPRRPCWSSGPDGGGHHHAPSPLRRPRLRHQALRRADGGRRHRPGHRRGRVLHHARPQRLRQDDDPADDRRLRGRHRRPPGHRRREHAGDPAPQAPHQHRLPELRALPAPLRQGERRLRTAP